MSPQLPWGTVRGRATGVWADGTDEDLNPDLTVLEGLTVTLQPMIPAIVWHGDGGPTTHVPSPVVCQFDDEGYLVSPAQGSSEREVRLLASRHDQIEPSPWDWQLSWSLEEIPSTRFQIEAGQTLDLSSIILSSLAPASPELFHDLLEAAQHLETVLPDVQTARDDTIAARDVAVPAADRAEQARDATLTAATWTLTGPGRPDQPATTGGIITGSEPVGTDYRSTDGAGVGAWTWRRRPSGWTVTDGDTGWRDLSGLLVNGWTGTLIIRRVGSRVDLQAPHSIANRLDGSAATSSVVTPYPAGFRPAPAANYGNLGYMHGPDGPLTVQRETSNIGMQLGPSRTGSVDWITDAAWPTDLAPAAALPDESITLAGGAYWDDGEIVIPQLGAHGVWWIHTAGRVSDLDFSPEVLVPGPTPVILAATRYFAADRTTAVENPAGRIADTSGRNIPVPDEWTRPTPSHNFKVSADIHWVRLTFGGTSENWVVPGTRYRPGPDDLTPTYL